MAFFFPGIKSGLGALPLPIIMQQAQNPYMLAIAAVNPPAALPIFYNGGNVGVQVLEANGVRYPGLRLLKPMLESRPPPKPPVLKPMPRKLIAKKKQAPGGSSNKKKQPLKSLAELCDDLMEKLAQTQENNVVEIAEKKKRALAKSKAKKVLAAKPFFDLLPSGTCSNLLYLAFCARLTLGGAGGVRLRGVTLEPFMFRLFHDINDHPFLVYVRDSIEARLAYAFFVWCLPC
jgi:hypothetical protein